MAETTRIEWADATFSPWRGCTKVSPACDNCYAEAYGKRFGVAWGPGAKRVRASESYWCQPLAWDRKAAKAGRPLRVFCASLADVFDAEVPAAWRCDLFDLIEATPNLIWMLLTKRPNVALHFADCYAAWPLPNVWLGVTAENQAMADLRVPLLLQVPADKRFISAEPLLGQVDLSAWLGRDEPGGLPLPYNAGLDWVIAGGESGPGARPSHPDWFRSLRDQCAAAGVPYFYKQAGEWAPVPARDDLPGRPQMVRTGDIYIEPNGRYAPVKDDLSCELEDRPVEVLRRVGKKRAGRLLDGVEHSAVPT